jgi:hypothetical protein
MVNYEVILQGIIWDKTADDNPADITQLPTRLTFRVEADSEDDAINYATDKASAATGWYIKDVRSTSVDIV